MSPRPAAQDETVGCFLTVDDAAERARRGTIQIIDARSARAYALGHAPGALPLEANGLHPIEGGVRRKLPAAALARRIASTGLRDAPVAVYGSRGGSDAALVWWTLRAAGRDRVSLLDGGFEAWRAAGLPVSRGPAGTAAEVTPPFAEVLWVEIGGNELRRRLGDPKMAVIDTRSPAEFSGAERLAARGGHIPGAHLVPWDSLLTGEPPLLRPGGELEVRLSAALAASEAVLYCQSGPRAAYVHAALTHLGHPRPRLYLGSWAEWGNDDGAPVATGDAVSEASHDTRYP